MAEKRRTTIYDIARELNITPASVSRALKDDLSIGKVTKELVRKTALKLNYKPNVNARSLSTGTSKTLGVIVPKINDHFFANVVAGIEMVARQSNHHVLICQTDESFDNEKRCVELLINQNVACIIVSLAATSAGTRHLQEAKKYGIPVIQFDRTDESLRTQRIINDNEQIVFETVKHLATQGYKRIAHLAGPQNIDIYRDRRSAFEKALRQYKLLYKPEYIQMDCLTKQNGREAAQKLLSMKQPPDAIFAAADICALGALQVAKEMNIAVPGTLGICGFSNEPYTELTTPSLTTIEQGSVEMGKQAVLAFMNGQESRQARSLPPVIIQPTLVVRASTCRV